MSNCINTCSAITLVDSAELSCGLRGRCLYDRCCASRSAEGLPLCATLRVAPSEFFWLDQYKNSAPAYLRASPVQIPGGPVPRAPHRAGPARGAMVAPGTWKFLQFHTNVEGTPSGWPRTRLIPLDCNVIWFKFRLSIRIR